MRNLSIDYLKVVLAFSVVLLHLHFLRVEIPPLGFALVNGVFRLAVPLFLIITGYYFSQITSLEKLKSWFLRILILYVLWMIFYIPFWFRPTDIFETLLNIPIGYFVLWYLVGVMFGGLLLYFYKNLKPKYLLTLAIFLYLIGYLLQQIGNLHIFIGAVDTLLNWYPISRNFLFTCFPLLAIGFLIKKMNFDQKINIPIPVVFFSILLVIVESYMNYVFISVDESLDHLLTILIAAPIIFIYVKSLKIMGDNKNLALFSTAIFLIHPFFITVHSFFSIDISKILFVVVASIIAGIVLVLVNKKVKYIL